MIKKYFVSSIWFSILCLALGAYVGYFYTGTVAGAASAVLIVFVLSLLEVSISFDNAVVNATVLKDMSPLWRHRFLTWGMAIAVFGMRLVFPLLIVGIVAHLNPWEALVLAATKPDEYARIMTSVHHEVASFGGTFLLLVALKYFFDYEKDVHWIQFVEAPLAKMGKLYAIEVGVALLALTIFSRNIDPAISTPVMYSGIAGILTFLAVEGVGSFLEFSEETQKDVHRAGMGAFIYLEVLDASFSFDGVIGAFAITNNLFIIALGLGVGAMFVRSLTIMFVDEGALDAFRFLEHGAFWAVASLAVIMFIGILFPVHEVITGLLGATIIGLSVWSSVRHSKRQKT